MLEALRESIARQVRACRDEDLLDLIYKLLAYEAGEVGA